MQILIEKRKEENDFIRFYLESEELINYNIWKTKTKKYRKKLFS